MGIIKRAVECPVFVRSSLRQPMFVVRGELLSPGMKTGDLDVVVVLLSLS